MKKKSFVMVKWLLVISFLMISFTMNDAASENETDIGIAFEKTIDPEPFKNKPPLIDGGDSKLPSQFLPQTGELITSIIILLVGVSLFIFSLGLIVIRQLYQKTSWEE